jgi:hypothetical protein
VRVGLTVAAIAKTGGVAALKKAAAAKAKEFVIKKGLQCLKNGLSNFCKGASKINSKIGQVKSKIGQVKSKIGHVNAKIGQVKSKIGQLKIGPKLNTIISKVGVKTKPGCTNIFDTIAIKVNNVTRNVAVKTVNKGRDWLKKNVGGKSLGCGQGNSPTNLRGTPRKPKNIMATDTPSQTKPKRSGAKRSGAKRNVNKRIVPKRSVSKRSVSKRIVSTHNPFKSIPTKTKPKRSVTKSKQSDDAIVTPTQVPVSKSDDTIPGPTTQEPVSNIDDSTTPIKQKPKSKSKTKRVVPKRVVPKRSVPKPITKSDDFVPLPTMAPTLQVPITQVPISQTDDTIMTDRPLRSIIVKRKPKRVVPKRVVPKRSVPKRSVPKRSPMPVTDDGTGTQMAPLYRATQSPTLQSGIQTDDTPPTRTVAPTIIVAKLPQRRWLTKTPINRPTQIPTTILTQRPTRNPTRNPTPNPTRNPTPNPTRNPTPNPTRNPIITRISAPTMIPLSWAVFSSAPTIFSNIPPTRVPTMSMFGILTNRPTTAPSNKPSFLTTTPTIQSLSVRPTLNPTIAQTMSPTLNPTIAQTMGPMLNPTIAQTMGPSQSVMTSAKASAGTTNNTPTGTIVAAVGCSVVLLIMIGVCVYAINKKSNSTPYETWTTYYQNKSRQSMNVTQNDVLTDDIHHYYRKPNRLSVTPKTTVRNSQMHHAQINGDL